MHLGIKLYDVDV